MLKMFLNQDHAGDEPDFWEANWAASQFEESVRFCSVDPLRPLFEKYLRPDSLMLEGGCGMGHYIAYFAALGHRIVGLDFALTALKTLHIRQPTVDLVGGDVSNMPFPDKTFDLYYSGGVVEHFESGAEESLREARRVLKEDGVLLISVPYYNPLRRMLTPFKKDEWRRVGRSEAGNGSIDGKKFFQYAYRINEFKKMLADAGLETIKTQGYAVLWGIQEIPLVGALGKDEDPPKANSHPPQKASTEYVDVKDLVTDRQSSLLKRLVVSEDDSIPVLGLGVKFGRWAVANMMMYVCVRK